MNQLYATLQTYNTEYGEDDEDDVCEPIDKPMSINDFHVFEIILNSKNQVPETISQGTGRILAMYDPYQEVFVFDIRLEHIKGILACHFFLINGEDEIDQLIFTLFEKLTNNRAILKIKKTFSLKTNDLEVLPLLDAIERGRIVSVISTPKYPEGEIAGFIDVIY